MSFATTTIAGFLGRDPSVRTVGNDTAVSFSVGVTRVFKSNGQKQERTTWWNVTLWGARGQTAATYLKKGAAVICTGWPEPREYQDKNGVTRTSMELVNADFAFAPSSKKSDATGEQGGVTPPAATGTTTPPPSDDEPPF